MDTVAGTWLTIGAAAARLGVSERTLRRRIADGELTARKQKGRTWVLMADTIATPSGATDNPDTAALLANVAQLTDQVDALRGERAS